jgi:hypothetical protein
MCIRSGGIRYTQYRVAQTPIPLPGAFLWLAICRRSSCPVGRVSPPFDPSALAGCKDWLQLPQHELQHLPPHRQLSSWQLPERDNARPELENLLLPAFSFSLPLLFLNSFPDSAGLLGAVVETGFASGELETLWIRWLLAAAQE